MVFYDVDLRNAKLREFAFGVPWYMMPFVVLMKLTRAPFQGTTDDPPVEALRPFEVEESALPDEVRAAVEPLAKELESLGFTPAVCHDIDYPLHATRTFSASFTRGDGRAWARLHFRTWIANGGQFHVLFPMFFSRLEDGTFLVSSSGNPDMLMPGGVRMVNQLGAGVPELWDRHNRELEAERPRRPSEVNGIDGLREAMQQHHARLRDFNLARGVFQPLPEDTQQKLAAPVTPPYPAEDAPIHLALERLQNSQSTWRGTLALLVVTLLLFAAAFSFMSFGGEEAGQLTGLRERLWWIIPVLAFHELGHYLAMRAFGYRNVRMFFIPFFGAAVSGKHYNVPGWKKAVVALSGPVPGILLGLGLGAAGLYYKQVDLQYLSGFLLILNGLQLVPLLPLDGGWVVHAVVFARHPILETAFRVLAALALVGVGFLLGDLVLKILGGVMLIAVPAAWRMAAVADRLRRRGGVPASPDGQTIPPEAVSPILAELRAGSKGPLHPGLTAQQVAGVYEMLNARPPGVIGSIALLGVHFGSLAAAVVLPVLALVVMHWGPFRDRFRDQDDEPPALAAPALEYDPGDAAAWRGPKAPEAPTNDRVTLVAHFGDREAARKEYQSLQKEAPPDAGLQWFGESVLLTLAGPQPDQRREWKRRLEKSAERVVVDTKARPASVRLHCAAPDEATGKRLQAELRDYLGEDFLVRPMLLPPWSPGWKELPEKDRQRFAKARRTMDRYRELSNAASQAPEVQKLHEEMTGVFLQRKPEAIREYMEKVQKAIREEQDRRLEDLRAEADPDLDREALDLRVALSDATALPRGDAKAVEAALGEQAKLRRQLAQRLGAFPLKGDAPAPGSDREAISYSGVERAHGGRIELEALTFTDLAAGLPALAEWLCGHGCKDVTYDVTNLGVEDEGDPEDP